MFKKLIRGIGFLAIIAIVVIFFDKITRTGPEKKGNVRVSADLALFGAANAITGPGFMDQVAERMLSEKNSSLASFTGSRPSGGIAPGGLINEETTGSERRAPTNPMARAEEDTNEGSEESARQRLRRIQMLEIERGKRQMMGGGGNDRMPTPAASQPVRRQRRGAPSDAEIAAELSGFVNKLKRRATEDARSNPSVGSNLDELDRTQEEGDVPILSLDGVDNRLEQSESLRALQQLNKDGAHSLRMSRRGGMTDGSRDKAGKRFDGNEKTLDSIPIEEVSGAFGKKQIKTYGDGGGVKDLK